ncbi:MAG TPA: hypothetical protein PLK54_08805, partial [Ferruginibacter sp.]|nr:hypothetical protein [Ferruginibacter sp.]
MKADPYARYAELRPATSSRTWQSAFQWNDGSWMKKRSKSNALQAPWSVYEVHLGSWQRPVPT